MHEYIQQLRHRQYKNLFDRYLNRLRPTRNGIIVISSSISRYHNSSLLMNATTISRPFNNTSNMTKNKIRL